MGATDVDVRAARAPDSPPVLVTVSSRCVAGRVKPRYGYDGGGQHLARIGALLAGDLSGAKARLLQMVALAVSDDVAGAAEIVRLST